MTRAVRGPWAVGLTGICFVSWVGGVAGCGDAAEPPLPSARASARAPDAVDPSGLIEGPQSAFGLKLPLRSRIARTSSNSIAVELPFPLEDVSTYLRARLTSKSVDVGPRATVFQEASVMGDAEQGGLLNVTVSRKGVATMVTFLRRSPPREAYKPTAPSGAPTAPTAQPDAGADDDTEPQRDPDPESPTSPPSRDSTEGELR